MKPTHRPERTCIACGTKARKSALIRIAANLAVAAGRSGPRIDHNGRLPGRGAYLCRRPECDRILLGPGRLSYALRTPVSESEMGRLISELKERVEPQGPTETN